MTSNKNEQQTVSQAYKTLPEAEKLLYKTIVDMILLLWKHNRQN